MAKKKFLQTWVRIHQLFGQKFKLNLSFIVANASTHQGDSFEVQFMAKIGEINQEKINMYSISWRARNQSEI